VFEPSLSAWRARMAQRRASRQARLAATMSSS
jgi:hypothetical protein